MFFELGIILYCGTVIYLRCGQEGKGLPPKG